MIADTPRWTDRLASPRGLLAVGLIVSAVLMLLPSVWWAPLKGVVGAGLRPCQTVIADLSAEAERFLDGARRRSDTVSKLTEAEENLELLRRENERLTARLEDSEIRLAELKRDSDTEAADRLLAAEAISARVLGRQARAFLEENLVLDLGARAGVRSGDPVIGGPEGLLIDLGTDSEVYSGQLLLSQGLVWGKIVEVGPSTSTARAVTEPGYRDLVRLATPDAEGRPGRWGPEGVLEGAGEPLAKIRLVEVTEPVSVGDLVFTAAEEGVLPRPLLYGEVVRVERPVGAACWNIWMEPAAGNRHPSQVAVLRIQLNPTRVAQRRED